MRNNTRIYAHVTRMLRVKSLTHVIRAYYAYDTRKWSTNTQAGVYKTKVSLQLYESGTNHSVFRCAASDQGLYGESKTDRLYVHFYSEDVFQAAGFRIAYRQVPGSI